MSFVNPPTILLSTIAELVLFKRGAATSVAVAESPRGGIFNWAASGTANNITIFACASGGVWNRAHTDGFINVDWADQTGSTYPDNSGTGGQNKVGNAIQACADLAFALNTAGTKTTVFFPNGPGWIITDTLNFANNTSIEQWGCIFWGATDQTKTVLDIGALNPNSRSRYQSFTGLRVKNNGSESNSWAAGTAIGIMLRNLYQCVVEVREVDGFWTGMVCYSHADDGFVENIITLGQFISCQVSLDIYQDQVGTDYGWVNDNLFLGGHFAVSAGDFEGLPRYGIRLRSLDDSYHHNSNVFIKPSFELGDGTPGSPTQIAYPITISAGLQNSFRDVRSEDSSTTIMWCSGDGTQQNICECLNAGTQPQLNDTSLLRSNKLVNMSQEITLPNHLIYHVPDITRMVFPSGSGAYLDGPLFGGTSSNATISNTVATATIYSDCINMSSTRYIGIRLQTTKTRRFVVHKFTQSDANGDDGRIRVRCYDSAGVVLTSASVPYPLYYGLSFITLTYASSYGGHWGQGSDVSTGTYFEVDPSVAYIDVFFSGGTQNINLKGFMITTPDLPCADIIYTPKPPGIYLATAPTTTAYPNGTKVWNTDFATNTFVGWVYRASDTTWVPFGALI